VLKSICGVLGSESVVILDLNTYTARTLLGLLLLVTFGLIVAYISQHFKHKKFCRLASRSHLARGRELKEAKEAIEKLEAQRQAYLQQDLSFRFNQEDLVQASELGNAMVAEMDRAIRNNRERRIDHPLSLLPYHNPNATVVHRIASEKDPPEEGPTILDRILADDA
jgi:hypothetical protein